MAKAADDLMVMAAFRTNGRTARPASASGAAPSLHAHLNSVIGALHDRMPVILSEQDWPKWLGEEPATPNELKALLVPCPDEALKIWLVDRERVSNVRNKSPEVAEAMERI